MGELGNEFLKMLRETLPNKSIDFTKKFFI